MRKGGDGEGAWGGEELLVECTKGITRKCKNLVHDFFLSYFLTVSQYCMQTDLLSWSFFCVSDNQRSCSAVHSAGIGCIAREINSSEAENCKLLETLATGPKHHHSLIMDETHHPQCHPHPLPLPPKRRLSIARNTLMAPYGMRELFWAARALPPPLQI